MKRLDAVLFISTITIVGLATLLSGCIGTTNPSPSERWIYQIYTKIPLNFSEVESINVTKVENDTKQIGFGFENQSNSTYYHYYIYQPQDKSYNFLDIGIHGDNYTRESYMNVLYSYAFRESKLNETKEFLKNKIDTVANICNLTVNTTSIQWNVAYQD